ncbi:MAG: glycosyltransferase family 9 protein [Bacteroidales bacterium]|jgi:heptosyltransferase-2|nr:glycosyltransferase family 9 protein [Bacteroidales bacterium]NPV37043.1 glycosyltransferase family 9 protein [Bacteroidales bacterium]
MKKVLVIQTASAGDVILMTPILEKLHHVWPEAVIDVLVKTGNETLFVSHPFIHAVWVWQKKPRKWRNLLSIFLKVRKERYYAVINCQRFASTGLLTAFSGAKVRVGFTANPLALFFSHRYPHRFDGTHETQRNLQLTAFVNPENNFKPRLYPSASNFARVSQYKTQAYITISPASLWFTKQFPEDKWAAFIDVVPEHLMVILLGASSDYDLCQRIAQASKNTKVLNLAGKLNFLESAALIRDARMNYVNDSAPMHIASAMNAPVAAIFCSTVPSFGFGPLSQTSFVIQTEEKLSCRPCGLHGFKTCPKKHFRCAHSIEIKQLSTCLPI